jgi:hypothetical protein
MQEMRSSQHFNLDIAYAVVYGGCAHETRQRGPRDETIMPLTLLHFPGER